MFLFGRRLTSIRNPGVAVAASNPAEFAGATSAAVQLCKQFHRQSFQQQRRLQQHNVVDDAQFRRRRRLRPATTTTTTARSVQFIRTAAAAGGSGCSGRRIQERLPGTATGPPAPGQSGRHRSATSAHGRRWRRWRRGAVRHEPQPLRPDAAAASVGQQFERQPPAGRLPLLPHDVTKLVRRSGGRRRRRIPPPQSLSVAMSITSQRR